jgi:CBS domain containing-hemolysin-like protein
MESHSTTAAIAILLLMVLSAFFAATETAFTSINRIKIKNLANDGNHKARRVVRLSEQYDNLLSTILIANNVVNIAATSIATVLFINLYGEYGPTIATIFSTVIILIFGEITPKTVAKEIPEKFSMFAAPLIQAIMVIMTPVTYFFAVLKKVSIKIFKVSGHHKITEDELMTMVEEAETDGGIDEGQSELIQNAIEFNDLVAIDVLTPRVDMEAIDIDMTNDEVDEIFRSTGFSRLPVYDDDLDEILGVLNQKDFHNYIYGKENSISDFVKPVAFVAGSMRLATLLRKLQQMKSHMAIIVDEYGGTEGLVTMEDIIEELVGEIYDEHDVVMSQQVTELQNGTYRVMCNANLANVFDFFEIEEEVDANTVNGWVVLCLDKLPEKGDTFEYTADFKRLKGRVTKANGKKAIEINLSVEILPED